VHPELPIPPMEVDLSFLLLQLVFIAAAAVFLGRWTTAEHRMSSQSWEALVAKLRLDWNTREVSDRVDWGGSIEEIPEDLWQLITSPRGHWVIFHNAKGMLDMVVYEFRNGGGVDQAL
jgi:hypothetical protein